MIDPGSGKDLAPPRPGAELDAGVADRRDFIQSLFRRAEELTENLLRDNERLRFRVLELETRLGTGPAPAEPTAALTDFLARIEGLEAERDQLLVRYRSAQRDSLDFEERSREIERENNNLANLYVASYQLHSTLDLREITRIIVEILLNFVGARVFAVLLVDERSGALRPLAAEGVERERIPPVPVGAGSIGAVVTTGRALLDGSEATGGAPRRGFELDRPLVVSPLRIGERVVGAIVIWEFLQQKTELADVDHELLNLLAAHAASAIMSARLAADLGGGPPALGSAVDLV